MGAFNVLTVNCRCASCGAEGEQRLQFKYGDTWQFEYRLGDALSWGGNDKGQLGARRVVVDAISDCGQCGAFADYEIFVENDVLTSFQLASGMYDFGALPEDFIVLE